MRAVFLFLLLIFSSLLRASDTYQCPMKCEGAKVYAEPGSCPKCGMDVVKRGAELKVRMKVALSPSVLLPGKTVRLTLSPVLRSDGSLVKELEIVHEKPLHLFLLAQDLSWFQHQHPLVQADGSYALDIAFPFPGNYVGIADFKPKGEEGEVAFLPIQVAGKPPPPKPLTLSRQWKEDGYVVGLTLPKGVKSGAGTSLKFKLLEQGKAVSGLDPYLGALGHSVGIHEDTSEYFHAHPSHGVPKIGASEIEFHASFPKAGKYKIWMQFQHKGRLRTADFVVKVP